jgi:hypothetical protein
VVTPATASVTTIRIHTRNRSRLVSQSTTATVGITRKWLQ